MEAQRTNEILRNLGQNEQNEADGVEIIFYTDPLCCWSWGFEPQWRRLLYEYGDQISCRYVMTGLLPSWKNYNDPIYSVSRPQQMGPVWMEASDVSKMPINSKIWVEDAPASSYPACIAVKSIELQSQDASGKYLRMLREAVMLKGKNIAKQEVLIQVAEELLNVHPNLFNLTTFCSDLTNDNGLEAFRADWQEAQNRNISRTPTLIMRSINRPAIMLTGYRPYAVLLEAVKQVAPAIEPFVKRLSAEAYKSFWGDVTAREIEEIL